MKAKMFFCLFTSVLNLFRIAPKTIPKTGSMANGIRSSDFSRDQRKRLSHKPQNESGRIGKARYQKGKRALFFDRKLTKFI
jgi:hypothetical protein